MVPHFGFDPFNHVRFPNCRDTRHLGAAIVVGKGLNARAHMNANAGNEPTPDDFVWKPDPEKKAKEFGVDMVVANTGRIWTFDHGECQYGYGWEFDGAKMSHLGTMVAKDLIAKFLRDEVGCVYQAVGFDNSANFVASSPVLVRAAVRPKVSFALREKIFLAVTSVTDCRYCQWGHTHWAMAHGVPMEEVNQILGQQIESLQAQNPAEAAAILFAQHYAEHGDQCAPESLENLRKHYSDAQVAEILAYMRAITLGSLTGNTADAFLSRFRSHGHTERGL